MKLLALFVFVLAACGSFGVAAGQQMADLPAGGVEAVEGPLDGFANGGKAEVREEKGVYTVRVEQVPANLWDVGFVGKTSMGVERDDVMVVEFTASGRGTMAAEGYVNVVFERAGTPHDKALDATASVGAEKRRYVFPFTMHEAFPAGGAQVSIRFGEVSQEVTVSDLRVLHYGKRVKLSDLPVTRITYPGMEDGAAWRAAALERIEKLRKGDLTVTVVDAAGKPVAGAEVRVEMTRHGYRWGTCVPGGRMFDETPQWATFREKLLGQFNYATVENDLKWPNYAADPAKGRRAVDWLREKGLEVRGHNMIWPAWEPHGYLPKTVVEEFKRLKATDAEAAKKYLRAACAERVRSVAKDFAGKVRDWDVINEPYANHQVMDELGSEVMIEWFKLARENDPAAVLYLNDYGILEGGGRDKRHIDHFYDTLKYLKDGGAPLGGVGIQGHFSSALTDPEVMLKILDRFAGLGVPIQITEFDVNIADEATQAAFTRDFMITVFSHPATDGFIMWGFWEGSHWLPKGAMYRRDWSAKPNAEVYREWVLGKWWTRETVRTDAAGVAKVRGFAGTYEVRASDGGREGKAAVVLPVGGAAVTVKVGE